MNNLNGFQQVPGMQQPVVNPQAAMQQQQAAPQASADQRLIFGRSYTKEQFKSALGTSQIAVHKNPNTGKLFLVDDASNAVGGVSTELSQLIQSGNTAALAAMAIVVSEVTNPSTGDTFHLMHKKGQGSQPIFTF